jgi:hypothetical protein
LFWIRDRQRHQRDVASVGVTPAGMRPVIQPTRAKTNSAKRASQPVDEWLPTAMTLGMARSLQDVEWLTE